jgi:hypothetical protein
MATEIQDANGKTPVYRAIELRGKERILESPEE